MPVETIQADSGSAHRSLRMGVSGATRDQKAPATSRALRFMDAGVFGIWLSVVVFTLAHHEKWADEAQAWLIARDLDLRTMWFHELRYEGSPGLWHTILWIAQHVFHARYAALGGIGLACAAAGVAFVLWKAPFPRPLRYLLIFSYFLVYQYAVIARSYVLFPLFAFWAASAYHQRKQPERMALPLALLCLLSAHGILLACALGLAYLLCASREWSSFDPHVRRRYLYCVLVLVAVLLFTCYVVEPTADVDAFAKPLAGQHVFVAAKLDKLASVLSGALMDCTLPSAVFLLLAGVWCAWRRQLLPFLLPTAALIGLYVFVHGQSHHHGTVFIAVIAGLWVAWPQPNERARFTPKEHHALQAMTALLACLLAVNVWDAMVSARYEYLYPYSGAEDAARYLHSIHAEKARIFGYTYGMPAVQAYFDRNILENMPTTYYHHGAQARGAFIDLDELRSARPDYLVFLSGDPSRELASIEPTLFACGYQRVHFSDGYLFFKRSLMDRQLYVIYQRVR